MWRSPVRPDLESVTTSEIPKCLLEEPVLLVATLLFLSSPPINTSMDTQRGRRDQTGKPFSPAEECEKGKETRN